MKNSESTYEIKTRDGKFFRRHFSQLKRIKEDYFVVYEPQGKDVVNSRPGGNDNTMANGDDRMKANDEAGVVIDEVVDDAASDVAAILESDYGVDNAIGLIENGTSVPPTFIMQGRGLFTK